MVLFDSITTMRDETQKAERYPRHELSMFHISGIYESYMFIKVLRHD